MVFVALTYGNSRISWYGYECRIELREVPDTGMNVLQTLQKYVVGANTPGMVRAYPTEHNFANFNRIPTRRHQQQPAARGH